MASTHDPNVETLLVRYPLDHAMLPGALISVHPANGRTSLQNATAVHPDAAILCWESSGDLFVRSDFTDDDMTFVNAKPKRDDPLPGLTPTMADEHLIPVVAELTRIDNAAHAPDATKADQPVTPAVVAQVIAQVTGNGG